MPNLDEKKVQPLVDANSDKLDRELAAFDDDLLDELDDGEEEAQPVAPLKLTDLFEEKRLEFVLDEGKNGKPRKVIYFIDPRKIDAPDTARMMKLQKITQGAMKAMERNVKDTAAVARFENIITSMVRFILPDLPEDILTPLTYAQRAQIVAYFSNNTDFGAVGKKAQPGS